MEAYSFDFASRTLTMTKAFAEKAASDLNSDEYKIIKQFQSDIPNLRISYRTHCTPTKYKNSNGTTTKKNQFKGLTFERMEKFINAIPNSEQFLVPFTFLKEHSSYTQTAKWFMAQFPDYRSNPLYYYENDVKVINYADYIENMAVSAEQKKGA